MSQKVYRGGIPPICGWWLTIALLVGAFSPIAGFSQGSIIIVGLHLGSDDQYFRIHERIVEDEVSSVCR